MCSPSVRRGVFWSSSSVKAGAEDRLYRRSLVLDYPKLGRSVLEDTFSQDAWLCAENGEVIKVTKIAVTVKLLPLDVRGAL